VTWKEIDAGLDPRDFTLRTAAARFRDTGDLWAGLRTAAPVDLAAVLKKY
jgi:DNA primase